MEHAKFKWHIGFYVSLLALLFARIAQGCDQPSDIREATPEEIRSFFKGKGVKVLTFLGYSAAEYENKAAMLEQATRILDEFDPRAMIVNIGATPEGMGAVYEIAKQKGFLTTGIVSTQAKENNVKLSRCVDVVFYVRDATWGGFTPGTERLSPTSTAMVENSDVIVAIGGGEVSRDELIAAKRLGKKVQFIPADMNHEIARERARQRGQLAPTDFRGATGVVF
jgi:predicted Rossmann-fold nucleotide-binding protein